MLGLSWLRLLPGKETQSCLNPLGRRVARQRSNNRKYPKLKIKASRGWGAWTALGKSGQGASRQPGLWLPQPHPLRSSHSCLPSPSSLHSHTLVFSGAHQPLSGEGLKGVWHWAVSSPEGSSHVMSSCTDLFLKSPRKPKSEQAGPLRPTKSIQGKGRRVSKSAASQDGARAGRWPGKLQG